MEWCVIVITPDALRRRMEDRIITDVTEATRSQVVRRRRSLVREDTVRFLYPKLVMRGYFPAIVRNFVAGDSEVVLFEGPPGLNATVNEIKGKFRLDETGRLQVSGLRLAYGASIESGDGHDGVFEFRFHTSDDHSEAEALVSALL